MMADSGLVDFLSGSTDSAIDFSGSADIHTPSHLSPTFLCSVSDFEDLKIFSSDNCLQD